MPHENGRIFTNRTVSPPLGVDFEDIQATLGISGNYANQLCTSTAINKWAKYRPMERTGYLGILTDNLRKAGNWGIGNIPVWTNKTLAQMVNFWAKSGNVPPECGVQSEYWTRVLPSTQYRIRDFAADVDFKGYFHGAPAPIAPFSGSLVIASTNQLDVIYPKGGISDETLMLEDFGDWKNYYFGVVFASKTTSTIYIVTQSSTLENATDFTVHIPSASVLAGTWYVFPILSSVAFPTRTNGANNTSANWVALLDATEETISAHGFAYTLNADNASKSGNTISYQFSFTNDETSTGVTDVILAIELRDANENVLRSAQLTVGTVTAGNMVSAQGDQNLGGQASACTHVVAHIHSMSAAVYADQWVTAHVGGIDPRD